MYEHNCDRPKPIPKTPLNAENIYSRMRNFIVFSVFDVKHSFYLSAYDIWQKRVNFQKSR